MELGVELELDNIEKLPIKLTCNNWTHLTSRHSHCLHHNAISYQHISFHHGKKTDCLSIDISGCYKNILFWVDL